MMTYKSQMQLQTLPPKTTLEVPPSTPNVPKAPATFVHVIRDMQQRKYESFFTNLKKSHTATHSPK